MYHAIYTPTGDLVDAEDLWDWEGFDPNAFACPDCETRVFPRSYKPENEPRAHFAARPKCPDWCDSNGVAGLIERAQRVRLTDADGNFPGVMPGRLRVDLVEQEDEVRNGRRPAERAGGVHGQGVARHQGGGRRQATTASFRQVCRAFLDYPHDRDQPLAFDEVPGHSYATVFWRLRHGPLRVYGRAHLFFAPLSWSRPVATEGSLTVALDAKEWLPSEDGSSRKPGRNYVAKVDWSEWPRRRRNALEREIETARREAIDAKNAGKARTSYLFFVGEQLGDDLTMFHVRHRKLLCALSGALER